MKFIQPSGQPLDLRPRPLCLEFTNTVGDHANPHPREFLESYADLAAWAQRAGVISASDAARLEQAAAQDAIGARAALLQAIDLREAIYRIFVAHLRGNPLPPDDVDTLNAELMSAMARVRLRPGTGEPILEWEPLESLESVLGPIAVSAAELLTTPELLERVGQCADEDGCGWLFLDLTKNRSRRWCDMRDCGNRAKARRYSQRAAAA